MKKTILVLVLCLLSLSLVFAEKVALSGGYAMHTEKDDAGTKYTNGYVDAQLRINLLKVVGIYGNFDYLVSSKATDSNGNSTSFSGNDLPTTFDFQAGVYLPVINLGLVKIPFGAGFHGNLSKIDEPYAKVETMTYGFGGWAKVELMLLHNIGLYAGADFNYDMKINTKGTAGGIDVSTTEDIKEPKFEPTLKFGVVISF